MARLEDIPKNTPFTTPEGYFDELPEKIHRRTQTQATIRQRSQASRYGIGVAMAVVLLVAAVLFLRPGSPDAEAILASVETEELIDYLQDTGMSTDEMLEGVDLTPAELDALETEVYSLDVEDIEGLDLN